MSEILYVLMSKVVMVAAFFGDKFDKFLDAVGTFIAIFVDTFGLYVGGFLGTLVVSSFVAVFVFLVSKSGSVVKEVVRFAKKEAKKQACIIRKKAEDIFCYLILEGMRRNDAVYEAVHHSVKRDAYIQKREFKMYKID